jgi:predicted nucleic acid-binding protein
MRRVIVNSTPIIVLAHIGQLDLLKKLYTKVFIPRAVYDEVSKKKDIASTALKNSHDWIIVSEISSTESYPMYKAKLHAGEVEVMILAQEDPKADLLIIDDNAAKKTAKYLGLTVTGTMGVLLKAKAEGLITEVSPLLTKIKENGFYISDGIVDLVLKQAGE